MFHFDDVSAIKLKNTFVDINLDESQLIHLTMNYSQLMDGYSYDLSRRTITFVSVEKATNGVHLENI